VGILSASSSVVRFLAPPPARLARDAAAAAVSRRAFREPELEGTGVRECSGWVGIHDPLATDLGPADLFFQQWLAVGFRWDRRVVPPKLLWIERRRLEAARLAERGGERLSAAERKEIKEEVAARLLARALPAPRLFDCLWNLDTGHVYFTGKVRAAREAFGECFRQTFGVSPVPLVPYLAVEHVGLDARQVEAVRAVEPATFVPDAAPRPRRDVPRLPLEPPGVEA
jgi:recombination associated protein RdgC